MGETDEKKEEETKQDEAKVEKGKQEESDKKETEKVEDEAQVEKGIFKLKKDLEDEKEQDETNEGKNEEKAADSFVNDIYTSEGKQEPIETVGEIKDQEDAPAPDSSEVNKDEVEVEEEEEETKEEKAADSFVNDVSEAEGRQEPCVESEKEEKQEESHSEPEDDEEEEVKPGVLTVHVIEASNLLNKDILGKSDPYVEISFEETKVKSSTVTNSLSPQWNFISNFDVTGDDTSSIKFSVFDADFGKDQLLGSCSISIKDALSELDSARWISLDGPESGKISIKFGFTEKQDQNEEVVDNSKEAQDTEEKVEETKEPKSALEQGEKTEVVQSSDANLSSDKQEDTKEETPSLDTSEKTELVWADEVEREKNEAYEMNIERAEKVVEEIVLKAEKVM